LGITQAEIDEATHVAMTVGATRMQVMLRSEAASLSGPDAPAPTFQAQEVVSQAAGG
jgi:hypothetical protein